jgi:hypothetical protein
MFQESLNQSPTGKPYVTGRLGPVPETERSNQVGSWAVPIRRRWGMQAEFLMKIATPGRFQQRKIDARRGPVKDENPCSRSWHAEEFDDGWRIWTQTQVAAVLGGE